MAGAYNGAGEAVPVHQDALVEIQPRRQFESLAFLVGLGGVAYLGYCVYKKMKMERRPPTAPPPPPPELKIQKSSKVIVQNSGTSNPNSRAEISSNGDASVADLENNNNLVPTEATIKVVLHQCPRGYNTPCVAPFPLKLETFLRVSGIPYDVDFSVSPDDGNVPWMTLGGQEIHESHECMIKLCEVFKSNLDANAQNSRLIACRLVGIMLESHIYWGIALWRWVYDEGRSMPLIQPLSPAGLAAIKDIGSSVNRAAYYHGLGRLTSRQVTDLILKDLGDLSSALGKHSYFLGETPGEVDCAAFAMLAQMIWNMPKSPFESGVKQYRNLVDFVLRMRDNFWPDWQNLLQVRGEENYDGSLIYPGSEFLQKRMLNSGSSQWDSKSASTVTMKDGCSPDVNTNNNKQIFQAFNMQGTVNPGANIGYPDTTTAELEAHRQSPTLSYLNSAKSATDSDYNNNPEKIPLATSHSKNPFEDGQANFPPAQVQNIPQGMIRPRNGPPADNYFANEAINTRHYQQNQHPQFIVEQNNRSAYHPEDPQETMKNEIRRPEIQNHGNVIQRISQQHQNFKSGGFQNQIPQQQLQQQQINIEHRMPQSTNGTFSFPQYQNEIPNARDLPGNFYDNPQAPVGNYCEELNQQNYYQPSVQQPGIPVPVNQFYQPQVAPQHQQHCINHQPVVQFPHPQNAANYQGFGRQ